MRYPMIVFQSICFAYLKTLSYHSYPLSIAVLSLGRLAMCHAERLARHGHHGPDATGGTGRHCGRHSAWDVTMARRNG